MLLSINLVFLLVFQSKTCIFSVLCNQFYFFFYNFSFKCFSKSLLMSWRKIFLMLETKNRSTTKMNYIFDECSSKLQNVWGRATTEIGN